MRPRPAAAEPGKLPACPEESRCSPQSDLRWNCGDTVAELRATVTELS